MLFAAMLFFGINSLWAQDLLLTGTVTDAETKEPLIGAAVRVMESKAATVTDLDGNFKLNTHKGAVLEVTYIGYTSKKVTVDGGHVDISLANNAKVMDEVVVVGYGVQKKSSLTGSVSSMKSADLEGRSITNLSEAFQGKAAGISSYTQSGSPTGGTAIQVRGIGSNGSSAPLFVVDGRVAASADDIDPNNIESIEILKDASSAAIYGAAAGNGVILVTTKKGKGAGSVSFSTMLSSQSVGKHPHVLNSEQFIDYYTDNGAVNIDNVYNYWDFKQNTDWMDVAFENSIMQHYSVKFEGSGKSGNYFISGSYIDNNGIIVGNKDRMKRFTGMINSTYDVKKWLQVGTNNNISYSKSQSVSEGNGGMIMATLALDPLTPPVFLDGTITPNMRMSLDDPQRYGPLLTDADGHYYGISPYVTTNQVNPLIQRDRDQNEGRTFALTGTTFVNLKPFEGFTYTSRLSYLYTSGESRMVGMPYFFNTMGAAQNFVSVTSSESNNLYWQFENFANYLHTFNGGHTLGAMLGMSYSSSRTHSVGGTMSGTVGVNGAGGDIGFLREDPSFYYFAYATPTAVKSLTGGEPGYTKKIAYFGRLNYDYKGRYLAQFSLRADAADAAVLPMDNRWGYFPAGSLGWVVSHEKFMEKTHDWLSYLKLRASWGQNGSIASLGGWMYKAPITRTGQALFGETLKYDYGYAPTMTGNRKLKWETSEQFNIGVDANFFNNRLTLSLDYFNKKTKDLIVTGADLGSLSGLSASPINAGAIANRGVEVELGWQDHIGDLSYSVRTNMSTLRNRVTKVQQNMTRIASSNGLTNFEVGYPAWYFYGYKVKGIDPATGDAIYEDLDGDKNIGDNDRTYLGKGIPGFTYGITLTAAWKGIDLLVFGSGVADVDIYNQYNRSDGFINNKLYHFYEGRWTPEHTDAVQPRASYQGFQKYNQSSAVVFDGSYFRIKQIQLGYSLPANLINKVKLSKARIYCSLDNFFTFSNYIGFDPAVMGIGSGAGIDNGQYPTPKKVTVGLDITF